MLDLCEYTEKEQKELLMSIQILVDTREKERGNAHILEYFDKKGISWKRKKLDYCDYSFRIPANDGLNISRNLDFSKYIAIERKNSLEEISSCFTESRDRLKKEFALAPPNKIMIIENASYEDLVSGNYNTRYDKKSFAASYHSFWHEFNLPIMFIKDPSYTGHFIISYFYYYLRQLIK